MRSTRSQQVAWSCRWEPSRSARTGVPERRREGIGGVGPRHREPGRSEPLVDGAGATELGAAISALGGEKVLVVASSRTPSLSVAGGLEVIYRPLSLAEGRQEFLERIAEWFERRAIPAPEPGSEAENLLRHSQWRAAMIAAMSDLEVILMERFGASTVESMRGTFGPRRPTFRSLIASEELPLDQELRGRLFDWSALRNSALHQRRAISAPEARGAVADVEAVRRLI